ncbi:MAG: hypothetical protein MI754_12915 [Chromatiales bacterium]|nr:hypothetical protein [Chromatiales bacterium]
MSSNTFLANPKEMEAWIQSLPTANVGETSRRVFKTLVEFNRSELPNIARIKIAENFRQPIDYIASNLKKYYYDVSFPLSAKNRKIAVLNRELYAELAIAYKTFIEVMISGQGGKFDKKLLVIAIHRSLRYLGLVAYQSAIVYDPYPPSIWYEINRLFGFAEQNRIHQIPVKEGKSRTDTSTINDIYKQLLLFAIISPYRQRQREILHIYNMLPAWAEKTQLGKKSEERSQDTEFVIQLADDKPPLHLELMKESLNVQSRTISTSDLVTYLRSEFDQLPAENASNDSMVFGNRTSKHLLRQLIQTLSSAPKREYVRTKLNFELKTAVGLNAIHTFLSRSPEVEHQHQEYSDDEMSWLGSDSPTGQSLYTHSEQTLSLGGAGATAIGAETTLTDLEATASSTFNYAQSAPSWANSPTEGPLETFVCKTVNESAGGYCIHWNGTNAPRIRVGEIIGIQSATNSNQFGIGISRWMKNIPGFGLQLGLEMVSPGSIPITVETNNGPEAGESAHKGLLLPELKSSGKSASLIVGTMLFKIGDSLLMQTKSGSHHIRLTRLLESTGAFTQFQFVYKNPTESLRKESEEETDGDFDNIWSML